jgi:hypothetical protein
MKKETTVFLLIAYTIDHKWKTGKGIIPPSYPEFKVSEEQIGIYSTQKQAENAMKRYKKRLKKEDSDYIKRNKKYEVLENDFFRSKESNFLRPTKFGSLYGFRVEEIVLDMENYDDGRYYYINSKSSSSYLVDGSCCVEVKNNLYGGICGGGTMHSRFEPGDVVEYLDDKNKVRLGVAFDEDTEAVGWSIHIIDIKDALLFKIEDKVRFIEQHVEATWVFPARFPVSEKYKAAFTRVLAKTNPYIWLSRYIGSEEVRREFQIAFASTDGKKIKCGYGRLVSEGLLDYGMDDKKTVISALQKLRAQYDGKNADYCATLDKMLRFFRTEVENKTIISPVTEEDKQTVKLCLDMVSENENDNEKCTAICCGLDEFMRGKEYIIQ